MAFSSPTAVWVEGLETAEGLLSKVSKRQNGAYVHQSASGKGTGKVIQEKM